MLLKFADEIEKIKLKNHIQPKVITFLGFMEPRICMEYIVREAGLSGLKSIDSAPRDPKLFSWISHPLIKLDAIIMRKKRVHLGLSKVENQAKAAYKTLKSQISADTPIILCGHSQGGLVALHFWNRYRHRLNIKSIIILSSPLQGVTFFRSIASYKKLNLAAQLSRFTSIFKLKVQPFLVAHLFFSIFKLFSKLAFPALSDFLANKSFRKKMHSICKNISNQNLPVLNITCKAPPPKSIKYLPYTIEAMKMLVSGDLNIESDNILSLKDQKFPTNWSQLQEILINADHGAFSVPNAQKVFYHPEALLAINRFIAKNSNKSTL